VGASACVRVCVCARLRVCECVLDVVATESAVFHYVRVCASACV